MSVVCLFTTLRELVKIMAKPLLILADDLTGALDSAVGFAGLGRQVVFVRRAEAVVEALKSGPDVLAISTASREIPPVDAARRVEQVLSVLDRDAVGAVMKKVDSRLKGNIAAEVAALRRWMGPARSIACPAIPAMERRVEGGALLGLGVEIPIPVAARIGNEVEVPDIASDADLDRLVAGAGGDCLWIGARGLAFALARRAGVPGPDRGGLGAPVMIVNGSRDPVTLAQLDSRPDRVPLIQAPDGHTAADPPPGSFVLSISDGGGRLSGQQASTQFAQTALRLARAARPASLVICGGESAQAILDELGIDNLQLIAELRAGLPLCEVRAPWGPVRLVTKSGGFGPPELLASILEDTNADL